MAENRSGLALVEPSYVAAAAPNSAAVANAKALAYAHKYSHGDMSNLNKNSIEEKNVKQWNDTTFKEEMYIDYADLFGRYRDSMKSMKTVENMFLFGNPKADLLMVCMKLYHENMIKNLILNYGKAETTHMEKLYDISAMIGILRTSDGKLYVTISEDTIDDRKYNKKRKMVLELLRNANIEVKFDEDEGNENARSEFRPKITTANTWEDVTYRDNKNLRTDVINLTAEGEAKTMANKIILMDADGKDYLKAIRDYSVTVTWVDSIQYVRARRGVGRPLLGEEKINNKAFKPFKRYSEIKGTAATAAKKYEIACNNGSLCTESKLFGYFHKVLKKKNPVLEPDGFVAYWIKSPKHVGDIVYPPDGHVMTNYCFLTNNENENIQLKKLQIKVFDILKTELGIMYADVNEDKYREIVTHMVQPMALACPGCLSNVNSYLKGTMAPVNTSNCYIPKRREHFTEEEKAEKAEKAAALGGAGAASGAPNPRKGGARSTRRRRIVRRRSTRKHR